MMMGYHASNEWTEWNQVERPPREPPVPDTVDELATRSGALYLEDGEDEVHHSRTGVLSYFKKEPEIPALTVDQVSSAQLFDENGGATKLLEDIMDESKWPRPIRIVGVLGPVKTQKSSFANALTRYLAETMGVTTTPTFIMGRRSESTTRGIWCNRDPLIPKDGKGGSVMVLDCEGSGLGNNTGLPILSTIMWFICDRIVFSSPTSAVNQATLEEFFVCSVIGDKMEKVLVGNAPTVARDRPEIFLRILISEVHEYYFHRQISDHNQRIINYRYADTPMMQTLLHGLHKRSRGDTVSGIGTPQFDSPALAALHGGGPVPLTTTENLKSACQQLVSAQRPWSGRGDPERLLAAQNIAELAEEDRFGSLFTKEGYNIAYLRQAFARLHQRIRKADFEAKLAELVGGYTSKNNRAALTEFLTKGQILMVETMQGFKDDIREYGEDSITDEVSQGLRDTMNHEFGGIIVSRYHEYLRDAFAARLANLQDPHPEINNCCNELKRVIKQFNQGRETINPRDRQASLRRELTQLVKLRDAKQKAEAERMAKQDEIRRLEAEQAARDEEMRQRLAEVERQETQLQDTFAAKLKKEKAKLTKFQQRMSMKVEELRQKQEKIEEEERQRLTQERSCERCGSTFTEAENGPDKCQVDPQYTHSGNLITPKGKALVGGGIGSVALVAGAAALASNPIGWMVGGLLAAGGAVGGAGIGYGLTNMEYSGCGHPDGSDPEELNCNRQEFPKQRHVEYEESSSAGRIVGAGAGALVVARDLFL